MAIRIQSLNVNSIGDICALWHLDLQTEPTYFVAHVQDSVRMDVLDLCRKAGFVQRLLILAGVGQDNLHDPAQAPLLRKMIARHFPEQTVEREVFVDALAECGRKGPTVDEAVAIRERFSFLRARDSRRVVTVQPLSTDHERKSCLVSPQFVTSIMDACQCEPDAVAVLASPSQEGECAQFAERLNDSGRLPCPVNCRVTTTVQGFFAQLYNSAAHVGCESTGPLLAAFFGVPTWHHYRGHRSEVGPHLRGILGALPHWRLIEDKEHQ